ncbi:MAG: divalent-cation tolerance protein CutA [Gemmatimonadetes bacterium]|nr:divalent-cation tolerance protein CutA [Gemmatimonadota bacterium]MYF74150.1 divalent-cation tolerance protein CutA [Gemmatimonadota bacterium]MYK51990.1 divalent-cation tolerance protein CutA [Gemmatimonadota bacterium]
MRYRHIFGMGAFIALFFAMCMPAEGQVNVERLESIARHVAQAVLAEGDSLTAEQVAWVERMTAQLAEDVVFLDEQKQRLEEMRRERDASIRNIANQIAKGIGVLIALLVLWAIFRVFRRGLRAESGDDPLGVLIAMRTEARAQKLGEMLVKENLATGGTVAPSVRSIYRREDGVREAAEAMVFLKTTRAQLSSLMDRAEELGGGKTPELVVIREV